MRKAFSLILALALCLTLCAPALALDGGTLEPNADGTAKVRYFDAPYVTNAAYAGTVVTNWDGVRYSLGELPQEYVALVYGRTNCSYTLGIFSVVYDAYLGGADLLPALMCVDNQGGPGEETFAEQYPGALVSGEYSANSRAYQSLSGDLELRTGYLPVFVLLNADREIVFACSGNEGAFCSRRLSAFLAELSGGGEPEEESVRPARTDGYLDSGLTSMPKLTAEEIWQLLEDNGAELPASDEIFDVTPSVTAPYASGKVNEPLLQRAAGRLSALRAIAGLPSVSLDAALSENAQYGAVLLAASEFSHYPSQPADMDDDFYGLGRSATSSSNIHYSSRWGYREVNSDLISSVDGFMDDSDSSNISRLGHRRWQLNPTMGKVGFGYTLIMESGSSCVQYVAEKVFDDSGRGGDYEFIGWPASGAFPNDLFESHVAWSVTLNPERYDTRDLDGLTVTLTRESDGETWTFSAGGTSDGYYNVDYGGYGVSNCIIFRPNGVDAYEGLYTVEIDGIRDRAGSAADFAYQVDFFPLASAQPDSAVLERFDDVSASDYFADAVVWAVKNGVTVGKTETEFGPFDTVTRAQAMTFLWRAAGEPEPETTENPFPEDVREYDYFYEAVLWAVEQGITQGTGAGEFSPGQTCSEAHILTFLWRAAGTPGRTGAGEWYDDAVAWALRSGLTAEAGAASPTEDCPRADVVYYLWKELA